MSQAASSADKLTFTIFLAVAIHVIVILGVTFSINKSDKLAPTLNITLATHADQKAPEKADFLAQSNQQASGTEDDVKELTTTEEAELADLRLNKVNPLQQSIARNKPKHETELLDTSNQTARKVRRSESSTDNNHELEGDHQQTQLEKLERDLASLQAKRDQQLQSQARKPRITRHTSVSTKSSAEAAYYNRWSQKIETYGKKNFPAEAKRKNIYGSLRLSVMLRADGSVAKVEISESSGYKILDDAALKVVRLASPFDPFPAEIKKNTDLFEIIRTWNWEIDGLSTRD
ncbi:energy transducer TonB [Agaribacterium sp. ZY112]|uniref:energy transducer TonB n=1 Tax=Agaribacterium sp. ZY112 TaxID=3233574 RepID=UPI00352544E8